MILLYNDSTSALHTGPGGKSHPMDWTRASNMAALPLERAIEALNGSLCRAVARAVQGWTRMPPSRVGNVVVTASASVRLRGGGGGAGGI